MSGTDLPDVEATGFSIERARPDDAEAVYDAQRTTWLATYPNAGLGITVEGVRARIEGPDGHGIPTRVERWRRAIEGGSVVVARHGDRIVGFVAPRFDTTADRWRLGALYVLPEAHGHGLGHRLLAAGIAGIGREHDIYLHVATYNVRAIEFYRRRGFVETGADLSAALVGAPEDAAIPEAEMVLPALAAIR